MTKNEKFKDLCMELYLEYGEREFDGPLLQGSHIFAVERASATIDSFGQHKLTYKLTPEALELIRSYYGDY